ARGGGLSAALDVRLPTGDSEQLLGAGGTQVKLLLVESGERNRFGHHLNLGYTFGTGDVGGTIPGLPPTSVPDEFNYSGGLEFIAHPKLTVVGDIVGRTLRDAERLTITSKEFK